MPPSAFSPAKLGIAVALLAVAAAVGVRRCDGAQVDWHLGDLRRDIGDPRPRAALRRMGDRAIPHLERDLASSDRDARLVALVAVAAIEGPAADRLIAGCVTDADAMNAGNALDACARRTDPGTWRATLGALGDPRRSVRLAARSAAGRRGGGMPWWAFGRAVEKGG